MALTTGAFLSDSGNPSNGNGSDGDHYRDTTNQNLWFKAAGSWTLVGNLNDNTPDGIGTIWLNGSGVPLNLNGSNGDYYRNTDNQDIWFKVGGFWTLIFGTTQLTSATSGVRSVNGIQPDGNGDVTLLVEDLGGAAAPVQSVFGRTGAVTAQNGDYTAAQVGADAVGSAAAAQAAAVQRANHTGTQLASTISDFNATASAAAPVQSVNGNTGAVTVLEGDSREVRKTRAYWCEDFISYYTRTLAAPVAPAGFSTITAEDEQQWCIGGTQDAIGVVTLIPTASTVYVTFSASQHALASGAGGLVLTGKTIDASWSFCQKKATASDEGFVICAGFGVAATGGWSGSYPHIGFRTYDDAGVHTWEFITSTGGISTISTITWATSGCAQNTRITCRCVITAASVLFYINGTLHATHTTNIPTTQLPDQIWHAYANLGFTDTSYGVSIDYMDKLTTLNSPRAL